MADRLMRIGVLSNCQAAGIAAALRVLLPQATIIDVDIGDMATDQPARRAAAATLASCDHVLGSETHARFGPLATASLRTAIPDLHIIPRIYFAGFHPDTITLREGGFAVMGPTAHYHSRIAVLGFLAGMGVRDIAALYNALVFARLGYLQTHAEQHVLLAAYLSRLGIDGAKLVARWQRAGCFMHMPDRPKLAVLADIARISCAMIGLQPQSAAAELAALPDQLAEGATHPVFPAVADAAGVPAEGAFSPPARPGVPTLSLPLEEFITQSLWQYGRVSPDALRGAHGVAAGFAALEIQERTGPRRVRTLERGMALLTYHGTLLRQPAQGATATHLPASVPPETAPYLLLDFPDPAKRFGFSSPILGGVQVERGRTPGVVALRQRGRVLCPEATDESAGFTRLEVREWEGMLPVRVADLAALRSLVAHDWHVVETGEAVPRMNIILAPDFELRFGRWTVDLMQELPHPEPPGPDGQPRARLVLDGEFTLVQATAPAQPSPAPAHAALGLGEQLVVSGPATLLHLPMVICNDHRRWLFDAYAGPAPVAAGWQRYGTVLCRAPGAAVQFAPDGSARPVTDAATAAAASEIGGQTVLTATPDIPVAAGWVDAAVRLFAIAPYVAPATPLLVSPAGIPNEIVAAWQVLRVARPVRPAPSATCRAADMVWIAQPSTALLPPDVLRALRDRAQAANPRARSAPNRLLVHGLGPPIPEALRDGIMALGFRAVALNSLTPIAQIALFAGADWVAGATGLDLAGIAFCAAGTRVIELAQDAFDPTYWMLGAKIGLQYAILPRGDVEQFTALEQLIRLRQV